MLRICGRLIARKVEAKILPRMTTKIMGCWFSGARKITNMGEAGRNLDQQIGEIRLYNYEYKKQHKIDYNQIIGHYPYRLIPISLIRNPQNIQCPPDLLKDLVAFRCLKCKQDDLIKAQAILFPQSKDQPLQINKYTGINLYSRYFEQKIPQLIDLINSQKGIIQEKVKAFVILQQFNGRSLQPQTVNRIQQRKIVKQSPVLAAHYCHLLMRHRLNYTHLIPLLIESLSDEKQGFEVAKVIISINNFNLYLPQKSTQIILNTIQKNFSKVNNFQLIMILRLIFTYRSSAAKHFASNLQKFLMDRLQKGDLDFSVPLVLKTIKYSSMQRIPSDRLIQFMTSNMKRFQYIFDKANIGKGIFYCMLFSRQNKILPELLQKIKDYLFDTLNHLSKVQEVDEAQLISFAKLMLKFSSRFSQKEVQLIRKEYIKTILPFFYESSQALFFNLMVILKAIPTGTENSINPTTQKPVLVKHIQMLLDYCCRINQDGILVPQNNINKVAQITFQVLRHHLPVKLPRLCLYNYDQKNTIEPQGVRFLFYYLAKNKQEKEKDIFRTIQTLQPKLEQYLRKNKIVSTRVFFDIIDVCHRLNYDHPFFFKLLQNMFAQSLINNPDQIIRPREIQFIYTKYILRGYGSKTMKDFIEKVNDDSSLFQIQKKIFIQKQTKFFNNRAEQRRNKYNEQKETNRKRKRGKIQRGKNQDQ